MADPAVISARTTLCAAVLSFIAGIVSTGFGVYNARLNKEIAAAQQRLEGHEKFAGLVRESVDALSDSHKAGPSLAAIYAVADDDIEKRIVITIAASTHFPDVARVLAVLVGTDPSANRIAKEQNVIALIRAGTPTVKPSLPAADVPREAQRSTASLRLPAHRGNAPQFPVSAGDPRPPDTAQTDLLSALAKKSIGWVYYGRFGGARSRDASECLPSSATMPKPNDTIALCSARYLRAAKPGTSLGAIVGVAQPGVPLHVQNVALVPLGAESRAVWLEVTTD